MTLGTILVRADASLEMGTGHVMRCLALAQAWQAAGGTAAFAMAESTPAIVARLAAEGFQVCFVQARAGTNEDANATSKFADARAAEWIVADGYKFGAAYQELIKSSGRRLLCIDDVGGSESYSADLVLNQNLNAAEDWYRHRRPSTRLLLGTRYTLLRREFAPWRGWKRDVPAFANKVLITMGGSDPDNVTLIVVHALQAAGIQNLDVVIVVGGSNPHFESIAQAAKDLPGKIRLQKDAANMPELMAWADIAVSTAGSTCWEMCMLGLPAILIDTAENQRPIAEGLARQAISIHAGSSESVSAAKIAAEIEGLLLSSECRSAMSRRGRGLVDGDGSRRVVSELERAFV